MCRRDERLSVVNATEVDAAADRLRDVVRRTPLERSDRLSEDLGVPVLLKREDLQIGRSYKVRGAYNFISSLTPAERSLGVVCASAGNHGQGLAFACRRLEIEGRVFVPTSTPRQKRERIRAIGGRWVELVATGSSYDETSAAALPPTARRVGPSTSTHSTMLERSPARAPSRCRSPSKLKRSPRSSCRLAVEDSSPESLLG